MGTDFVRLFDKRLCDRILAFDNDTLTVFVDSRLQEFDPFSIFHLGFAPDSGASERLANLARGGLSLDALKGMLVDKLCFLADRIFIDYWACFAETFCSEIPVGAISNLTLLPHQQEEHFLLLQPEHVGLMLTSLYAHRDELRVMSESDLVRLESWRELCMLDSGRMVAYLFDM